MPIQLKMFTTKHMSTNMYRNRAPCNMQYDVCNELWRGRSAECRVPVLKWNVCVSAGCRVQSAECRVQCAECNLGGACSWSHTCSLWLQLCVQHSASYVKCPVVCALKYLDAQLLYAVKFYNTCPMSTAGAGGGEGGGGGWCS